MVAGASRAGSNRSWWEADRSTGSVAPSGPPPGSGSAATPSTIQLARACATPAEWVIHTASASQRPGTVVSPSRGMPSGVNENRPLTPRSTFASASAGSRAWAAFQLGSKSRSVKVRSLGTAPRSGPGRSRPAGSAGIARCP